MSVLKTLVCILESGHSRTALNGKVNRGLIFFSVSIGRRVDFNLVEEQKYMFNKKEELFVWSVSSHVGSQHSLIVYFGL